MSLRPLRILTALILFGFIRLGSAQEWTRFRGPNGTGISQAKTIPTVWTEKDINWRIALPGAGHSSPVLWGDRVFLTTADETNGQLIVLGVGAADGRLFWQKPFPFARFRKHNFNTFASSSPAVDADRVYLCWTVPARQTLLALNHEGKPVWERDLGPFVSQHGGGASPIVYKGKVILVNQQDGESFVIAVDAVTGETRWKTARQTTVAAYSTPCVFQPRDRTPELIFDSQSHGIAALDPETGKPLWELGNAFDKRTVSSPVIADDLIIGACGSGEGGNYLVAVRPGDPVSDKKPEVVYTIRKSAPYVPTSVCVGDRLFLWSDNGVVSCLEPESGALKWQGRVGGNFFSSPVWVNGRLFCVSSLGEVIVVEASDQFRLLARNPLGERTHSTPAVAGGRMFIHTASHLISVGGRTELKAE